MQTQQEFGIFTLAKFEAFLKGDPIATEVELYVRKVSLYPKITNLSYVSISVIMQL